jgi:hypothetical protein
VHRVARRRGRGRATLRYPCPGAGTRPRRTRRCWLSGSRACTGSIPGRESRQMLYCVAIAAHSVDAMACYTVCTQGCVRARGRPVCTGDTCRLYRLPVGADTSRSHGNTLVAASTRAVLLGLPPVRLVSSWMGPGCVGARGLWKLRGWVGCDPTHGRVRQCDVVKWAVYPGPPDHLAYSKTYVYIQCAH